MGNPNRQTIRDLLRGTDGATVTEIACKTALTASAAIKSLNSMPDAYIDRWQPAGPRRYAAVWCVVDVPAHCPRPEVRA
ncbi:hypothetical protein [Acidovorax sp.]|uniref:hypothetical protein n=1 Tax=Acidovorax sp. TaxID=1872122 RepID=UPI0025BB33DD|nr:hypothetical protein [Acidovorax sp.]MBW8463687.1 hypothetical protein [Acidovorax sp.]